MQNEHATSGQVQILLSTYNGEPFLAELLDSLLEQDYPHLRILARDDGSSDGTVDILKKYRSEHQTIEVFAGENLGFVQSFFELLKKVDPETEYIGFCDQDDVWLPDKVSRAVKAMSGPSREGPTLYGSRLKIVDQGLNALSDSTIPPRRLSFDNALVESSVVGCTMLFNRSGYELLARYPDDVIGHDWWVYLVFSAFGEIIYDPEAKILYRQHDKNVYGLSNRFLANLKVKISRFLNEGKDQAVMRQVEQFAEIYLDKLTAEKQETVRQSLGFQDQSLFKRLGSVVANKTYRQNQFDNFVLKFLLLCRRL